jgi:hypothetical protein
MSRPKQRPNTQHNPFLKNYILRKVCKIRPKSGSLFDADSGSIFLAS